jgi:Tfp pilus assembly protein PilF
LAIRLNPADREARRNLGHLYLAEQKPLEALTHLKVAVAADPKDVDAYFNLAVAHQMLGQAKEATTFYRRFIELASDKPEYYDSIIRAERAIYELK